LLRAERERLIQQQLHGIHFSQLQQDSHPDHKTDDKLSQEDSNDDSPQ
jgi:hypothetical protein